MIKAKIERDSKSSGFWIVIEHDDETKNTACAITEDELIPIRDAINEFLKAKNTPCC